MEVIFNASLIHIVDLGVLVSWEFLNDNHLFIIMQHGDAACRGWTTDSVCGNSSLMVWRRNLPPLLTWSKRVADRSFLTLLPCSKNSTCFFLCAEAEVGRICFMRFKKKTPDNFAAFSKTFFIYNIFLEVSEGISNKQWYAGLHSDLSPF